MTIFFSKSSFRVLSSFFTDLAAGYVGLIIVGPSFLSVTDPRLLISNLVYAMLCLSFAVKLDQWVSMNPDTFIDLNTRFMIVTALAMIVILLLYIASSKSRK